MKSDIIPPKRKENREMNISFRTSKQNGRENWIKNIPTLPHFLIEIKRTLLQLKPYRSDHSKYFSSLNFR